MKMSRSIVLIFFYLWCFNATFNNISAISWRPVCMSDEYASDNVNRNAFKFCGKLIHFYKERISFLFYREDGKRGAVSWRYYRNPDKNAWISFLPHLLRVLLIEKRILPGIMVVDKFLFCLFWRMVHKSYTLNLCLEEWFINLLIHAYQYKILLRLFHHFSFHSCCSYWILVYFRFVLHFSIFRCVSHFSIFRFVSHFSIFRFVAYFSIFRCVIFRFVRCVSISFRSLVQPLSNNKYYTITVFWLSKCVDLLTFEKKKIFFFTELGSAKWKYFFSSQ